VVKDPATGAITELRCTYDPATRGGEAPDGRKVKGTIHWVSAAQALEAEVRLYDRLFMNPNPDEAPEGRDFLANLNPGSLIVKTGCRVEPSLASANAGGFVQFERVGYFTVDADSAPTRLVFNRSVSLRDSWGKIEKNARGGA
jgi:glutaminyl-tRNA synthetase